MQWYFDVVFKKYAKFEGRARRTEFWMYVLFNCLLGCCLGYADGSSGLADRFGYGPLHSLYMLAVLVPGLAVGTRRLHDTGKSGWWILLAFIPFGGIVLLIFWALDSSSGSNQYGANPKEVVV